MGSFAALVQLLLHGGFLIGVYANAPCGEATPYCRNIAGADPSSYEDCAAFKSSSYSYEECNAKSPFLCGTAQNQPTGCDGTKGDCSLGAGSGPGGFVLSCANSPFCAASVNAHATMLPTLSTLCNQDWPGLATAAPKKHLAQARKDPHLHFAHGGRADFRGEHNAVFNLLSARNLSLNAQFFEQDLRQPRKSLARLKLPHTEQVVHGTVMRAAFWTVRTASSLLHIAFDVTSHLATINKENQPLTTLRSGQSLRVENVNVTVSHRQCQVTIDSAWDTLAKVTTPPYTTLNPGVLLMDFTIKPLYDEGSKTVLVAPHGLIGQSFDGDDVAVDGAIDKGDSDNAEVTTKAQAEGAIEGHAFEYKMASQFATEFKYSRFDSVTASARSVVALSGAKHRGHHGAAHTTPLASE